VVLPASENPTTVMMGGKFGVCCDRVINLSTPVFRRFSFRAIDKAGAD
jgi:hypothetical protein